MLRAEDATLRLMTNRIGYPERWRDDAKLAIDRGPYVLNVLRASTFEVRRQLDKIGQPVDRGEWDSSSCLGVSVSGRGSRFVELEP